MRKLLSVLFLFLFLACAAQAQPQHVGLLATGHFEASGGGNGTIVGLEAQGVYDFRVYGEPLKIIGNVSFTLDEKVYRHQFGGAVRSTALIRYSLDRKARLFFIQGGVNAGGIAFPNTPGTSDGYAKYTVRPVAGGGVAFARDNWSAVLDYQFHFKRKLYANTPAGNFANRFVDGWTSGQRVNLATTYALPDKPQWLLLFNASAGWNTYQRNPTVYGAQLGSVVHRFNDYQISLGVGRKY